MKEKRCEILEGKRGIPHGSSSSRYGHKRIVFLFKKKKSEFQTFYTVVDFEFVFLPDYYWKTGIFLINILSIGFATTLWLRGITHTESSDVLVNGFGLFWNLLPIKSSKANSTPPMWSHFPFPRRPRPADYVNAARNTSQIGENSHSSVGCFLHRVKKVFPYISFVFKNFALQFFHVSFQEELTGFQLIVMRSSQHDVVIFSCGNNGVIVKLNEIHLR